MPSTRHLLATPRGVGGAAESAVKRSGAWFVAAPSAAHSTLARSADREHAEVEADSIGANIGRALVSVPVYAGPLSAIVRRIAEPLAGGSLGGVVLKSDAAAAAAATRESAEAITRGLNISFAAGRFAPDSERGRALIGHELAHTAQQGRSGRPILQRFAPVIDYVGIARRIEKAVRGWGTDEEAIYRALDELTRDPAAVAELEATYARLFHETLMHALDGDLNREEFDYAKALMGKPVSAGSAQRIETAPLPGPAQWDAQARRIKAAVEYRTWGFLAGTDEEAIFAVLRPLSGDSTKIAEIKEAYARITGGPPSALADALQSELSGSQLSYALQLLAVPDPHAGTQAQLSRQQVLAVRNELQPGTAVAPPAPAPVGAVAPLPAPALWDGRPGLLGAAAIAASANRAALQADLTTDLTNHLARVMPIINPRAVAGRIPVAALEGPANAAVKVTDSFYRSSYAVAASTPGQAALRAGFAFTVAAGNLRDANDPAARAAFGIPISAESVAEWAVSHDAPPVPPGAVEHMAAHNFDPESMVSGEQAWLHANVIVPFAALRKADLEKYDQFGFALHPAAGKIVLPTSTPGSSLAGGGAPNLVDRQRLWSTWHIGVHEYLHNLVHPAFGATISGPVMREGFTEYFTKGVLTKAAPVAHQNPGLVGQVEGGIFAPPTTPAIVGPYSTTPTYAADLAHVETLAGTVPGGDNALRAAYFQGHVETLGFNPATHAFELTAPVAVNPSQVRVPAGIASVPDLARRSGVPQQEILRANLGLAAGGPLPPALILPGCREHSVAGTFVGAAPGPRETIAQIAAQNGVPEAAMRRANPAVNWSTLALGQKILVPRH